MTWTLPSFSRFRGLQFCFDLDMGVKCWMIGFSLVICSGFGRAPFPGSEGAAVHEEAAAGPLRAAQAFASENENGLESCFDEKVVHLKRDEIPAGSGAPQTCVC